MPCALAGLAAIDRGTLLAGPQTSARSPWLTVLLAMLAVVVASASAFGCALLARSRLGLRLRALGCAAMVAATAGTFWVGVPAAPASAWRPVTTPSGRLTAELPGSAAFTERDAPGPRGGALLREAEVRAAGLRFVLQEREVRAAAPAESLLADARAQLVAGGAQVLAEQREARALLLTVRADGRRFRVRLLARPPLVWVASAGPEGVDDRAVERFLGSLHEE